MKLVELLAKELSEWPDSAYAYAQDSDAKVYAWTGTPKFDGGDWLVTDDADIDQGPSKVLYFELAQDYETAVINEKQWQAERDRHKGGEWKRHRGGKQPVANEVLVEFKFRSGVTGACYASDLLWDHQKQDDDVMQYRIISQPQAEEVEAKRNAAKDIDVEYAFGAPGEDMSSLDWKPLGHGRISDIEFDDVTTEEVEMIKVDPVVAANVEAFNRQWQIGRVDNPLVWRDTVTELNAYIEEFTREREELIELLASEGFALIQKINANLYKIDATLDMSDWRNWKEGDKIRMTADDWCDLSKGEVYKIIDKGRNYITILDDTHYRRKLDIDGETMFEDGRLLDFEFVPRP